MVFDDTLSTATVLTTETSELTIGEILYAPGWDGTLTKNGCIKLDGDIYRPPEKGYLDIFNVKWRYYIKNRLFLFEPLSYTLLAN